jgi:hypothetical protein
MQMPDQPDDPVHYDMKIPPEPKNATLNKADESHGSDEHRGSDEVTHESNSIQDKSGSPSRTPSRPGED